MPPPKNLFTWNLPVSVALFFSRSEQTNRDTVWLVQNCERPPPPPRDEWKHEIHAKSISSHKEKLGQDTHVVYTVLTIACQKKKKKSKRRDIWSAAYWRKLFVSADWICLRRSRGWTTMGLQCPSIHCPKSKFPFLLLVSRVPTKYFFNWFDW